MPEKLTAYSAFSTHMLPLRIFCEHVAITTDAKIALLLIQPKKTDFGEGMTPELEISAKRIAGILAKLLSSGNE
jgi:Ni,Fe-hydrogenase maturation factor